MKAVTSTIWLIEWTHWGNIRLILGLHWDNGKQNGDYRDYRCCIGIIGYILGLYWDN